MQQVERVEEIERIQPAGVHQLTRLKVGQRGIDYFQQLGHGRFRPERQDFAQPGIMDEIVTLKKLLEYRVCKRGSGHQKMVWERKRPAHCPWQVSVVNVRQC
ncbi:hypothetical protein [Hymenobacter sp. BRD67]|uniref:hypothetical protein n=1 Tax=Hymenobacter sp. BRD67 TaxID=2675877 RepID=UPI00156544B1|nr:hypothetical protein [Hymenobacter sp. BRD67]QKG52125.1 hypothetical protein GKZ67_05270 [Hymenobacter sp. BRD67]